MKAISRSINYSKSCFAKTSQSLASLRFASERSARSEEETSKRVVSETAGRWPRRVVTGLQPTGALHIGNYFAAVKRCVNLQEQGEDIMIFIADLHSLTTIQDGAALRQRILELTAVLLAAGVDPSRAILWQQSAVPRHAELCWVLACLATQARLHHLPQYREKTAHGGDVGVGVLLYPVLQAADVLLYAGTSVPVGADQLQHVQLAALLARTANHRFGADLFPAPQPLLPEDGSDRVRSLRDPTKKMSKSDPNSKARLLLTDSDDQIRLKIRKAITDFTPQVSYCPVSRPGVSNLVRLHCLAADLLPEEAVSEADHLTTAQYKEVVSSAVCAVISPLRARAAALLAQPRTLETALAHGAARARARADVTWERVRAAAGLTHTPTLSQLHCSHSHAH